ncbi:MAG: cobalamin B12-binding domain-containing protein [Desulfurococcaceae archaeon TW002]
MSLSMAEVTAQVRSIRRKVLVSKLGLDGHDRGAKVIARALRDAGFEVVYLGVHKTPEDVAEAAVEEDVTAIGISILSGSHLELVNDLIKLLRERGINVPVIVGGVIPPEDINELKKIGVFEVLTPGTPLKKVAEVFEKACEVGGS